MVNKFIPMTTCLSGQTGFLVGHHPDHGYVVRNESTMKWHPLRMNISFGDGFYLEGMGTIEQVLCISGKQGQQLRVTFRGQDILKFQNSWTNGDVLMACGFKIAASNRAATMFLCSVKPIEE